MISHLISGTYAKNLNFKPILFGGNFMKLGFKKFCTVLVSAAMVTASFICFRVAADDPHANFTPKYLAEITLGDFQPLFPRNLTPRLRHFTIMKPEKLS